MDCMMMWTSHRENDEELQQDHRLQEIEDIVIASVPDQVKKKLRKNQEEAKISLLSLVLDLGYNSTMPSPKPLTEPPATSLTISTSILPSTNQEISTTVDSTRPGFIGPMFSRNFCFSSNKGNQAGNST